MADSFSRRDALRASGVVATAALGGCLWSNPEIAPGHLYVENTSGGERELALVVGEQTSGTLDPEIQAWFRIPEGHALQFDNVLDPGITHVVRAELRNSPVESRNAAAVPPCSDDGNAAARVVSVRLQPDDVGIIPHGCQDDYIQQELEYVNALDYRIEPLDGTLTTTSQG